MRAKSFVLFVTVMTLGSWGAWAAQPQAVLSQLKGKVEIKVPGSKTWVAAVEGQTLSPAVTLSTGFDSSVVVVMDKTTIQVKPLTRITIDKLVEESGVVKTSTFLRVGSVSASVKSAAGVKQEFKVQSPYSTASVRGTEFDYDGLKLKVREGLVALIMGRPKREVQPVPAVVQDEQPGEESPAAEGGQPGGDTEQPAAEGDQPPEDGESPAAEGELPAGEGEQPVSEGPDDGQADDFVGAPEAPAAEGGEVFVGAGQDAKIEMDFRNQGGSRTTEPSEGGDDGSAGAPEAPKIPKLVTTGGLKLTITFAP